MNSPTESGEGVAADSPSFVNLKTINAGGESSMEGNALALKEAQIDANRRADEHVEMFPDDDWYRVCDRFSREEKAKLLEQSSLNKPKDKD
ncbi:hypothetical protein HYV57_04425 [Candidatus Peregrinibacteria bacterium]|nr:hypothetical protein [Candidatus Peregrinibacteria bacterium]